MSEQVKQINSFLRTATRANIDSILSNIILSDRQSYIFEQYYIRKQDVCFIADSLGYSPRVIHKELSIIRQKISVIIDFN